MTAEAKEPQGKGDGKCQDERGVGTSKEMSLARWQLQLVVTE